MKFDKNDCHSISFSVLNKKKKLQVKIKSKNKFQSCCEMYCFCQLLW